MHQHKVRKPIITKSFITLNETYADFRALQSFDVWENKSYTFKHKFT